MTENLCECMKCKRRWVQRNSDESCPWCIIDRLTEALSAEVVAVGFRGEWMEPIRSCRLCGAVWSTKETPKHNDACVLAAIERRKEKP